MLWETRDVFWEHENCLDFHANKINPFVQNLGQTKNQVKLYLPLKSYFMHQWVSQTWFYLNQISFHVKVSDDLMLWSDPFGKLFPSPSHKCFLPNEMQQCAKTVSRHLECLTCFLRTFVKF